MAALSTKHAVEDKRTSTDLTEDLACTDNMKETGELVDQDDALLRAQGHAAELERSFSWVGAVGLAFRYITSFCNRTVNANAFHSITNSWLTYATCFGIPLQLGGGLAAMVSVIIAAAFQWIVLLGLAEFCSALPSSGVRKPATSNM